MKYIGSKNRIAKYILPIILKDRKYKVFVEPFVGGGNIADKIDGEVWAFDSNCYVIDFLKHLKNGWIPEPINREKYNYIRDNKSFFPKYQVGYAGICASYSGKWFGGFAGVVETKGGVRDYQKEAINNVVKQARNFKNIDFECRKFEDLDFSDHKPMIIYCDPPYENTLKYKDDFNHSKFWDKCDELIRQGHSVFVSEYNAPDGWDCVWSKEIKSSLSANGKIGGSKLSTEKLFTKRYV